MKRKKSSLAGNIRMLTVIPLLCLGIGVLLLTSFIVYHDMTREVKEELTNLAHAMHKICILTNGEGDFSLVDGRMVKNGMVFDQQNTIVDGIQSVLGVDATIFYGDTRMLTTIRNSIGSRAIGTHSYREASVQVLKQGKEYFSENVPVNGVPYLGYYLPLCNPDGSIVGMVFVGKTRSTVLNAVSRTIFAIFAAEMIVIVITLLVSMNYSRNLITSLQKTKEFLGTVAQGDMEVVLDESLLKRNDEIGEMGRFSVLLQKSIIDLVGTDPLTGLYNRRSLNTILANTMQEYLRYQTSFVLAIGDIDNFKMINDRYGHLGGDAVLKQLAVVFLKHMDRKGFVARWGGEEFLLLYERMEIQRANVYLNELLDEIRSTCMIYKGQTIALTMTFGVIENKEPMEAEVLIKAADDKLYWGKKNGKNQVVI